MCLRSRGEGEILQKYEKAAIVRKVWGGRLVGRRLLCCLRGVLVLLFSAFPLRQAIFHRHLRLAPPVVTYALNDFLITRFSHG